MITFGLPRAVELAPIRNTGIGVNTGVNKAAPEPEYANRNRGETRENKGTLEWGKTGTLCIK